MNFWFGLGVGLFLFVMGAQLLVFRKRYDKNFAGARQILELRGEPARVPRSALRLGLFVMTCGIVEFVVVSLLLK